MAVGRISGPLLKSNLIRNGIDLAFETDLLYLDVNNQRIGVKTQTPQHELDVNGTTKTNVLEVANKAEIGDIAIQGNTISTDSAYLNLSTFDSIVSLNRLEIDSIAIEGNRIETQDSNADLEFKPNGTGTINVESDLNVTGDVYVTGNITADGNITIGDEDTDNVTFNAEVASDIIPDQTDTYDLGSDPDLGGKEWADIYTNNLVASTINSAALDVDGIDLTLRQGNIYYVAENGDDSHSGDHIQDPFASIKQALSAASSGDSIYIFPGEYEEQFPLIVPAGVTVKGHSLRSVAVKPTVATNSEDAFLLNGETTIEDLTVKDFFFDSNTNTGHAFRYANGFTVTTRSPYIRNVSVITKGSVTTAEDPRGFDQEDAGKGALLDGAVATAGSKEASGLFSSVTFITPGVDAVTFTNGVRVEWLSCFTYFAKRSLYAVDGASGLKGQGETALRVESVNGSFESGETIEYYDTDGVTLLESATIERIDADGKIFVSGKQQGFEEATERLGKTLTANGNAQLDTSVKEHGVSSLLLDGSGDFVSLNSYNDFGFGTGDFTVEGWIYPTSSTGVRRILDFRAGQIVDNALSLNLDGLTPEIYVEGAYRITGTSALTLNNWNHLAYVRSGSTGTLYLDGQSIGSWTDNTDYGTNKPLVIGALFDGSTSYFQGNIDDVRVIKGQAVVPPLGGPTFELVKTPETVLMARFDGENGSQDFVDDVIYSQDIRFSGGATARSFSLVDFTDFGAEVRMMSSASIYGDEGIVGNGAGVIIYAIGHNVSYIGSGKELQNDPLQTIQANEFVELNRAKVRYSSVDHNGDFRVGELFLIDQDTGDISFSSANFSIEGEQSLVFSDGTNTTEVSAEKVETGNIRISGNTVESLSGPINIDAFSNEINLENSVNISGDLDVTGDVTIGGNITIGDSTTDTIQFVAGIDSDIVPAVDSTYSLGTPAERWQTLFVNSIFSDDIHISDNFIETTASNADLELRANGSGSINIPNNDLEVGQNLTVNGQTALSDLDIQGTLSVSGDIQQDGSLTVEESVSIGQSLSVGARADFEEISIDDNFITTTSSNADLELRANGTGSVVFPSNNVIVAQSLGVADTITAKFVDIDEHITSPKYSTDDVEISGNRIQTTNSNSDLELEAAGTGNILVQDNNVVLEQDLSVAGISSLTDTNIQGNLNQTGNTVQVGDYDISGNVSVSGSVSVSSQVDFEEISINDNIIQTTSSNADLELAAAGTGSVVVPDNDVLIERDLSVSGTLTVRNIDSSGTVTANSFTTGNVLIDDNFITTTESNSDLELRANGTGSVVVPSNDLNVEQDLSVQGSTSLRDTAITGTIEQVGDYTQTGDYTLDGTISVSQNLSVGGSAQFENIAIQGNSVKTTESNSDLELEAAGTGKVVIPDNDVEISNNLSVSGTVNVSAISNTETIQSQSFTNGNIVIDDNFIETTDSNSDLELRSSGSGFIRFEDFSVLDNSISSSQNIVIDPGSNLTIIESTGNLRLPVGTTSDRPASPQSGQIRFNTTLNRFEGFDGTYWIKLNGVQDVDGDTSVTAELLPGANDNLIRFNIEGTTVATIDQEGLDAPQIVVDDIQLDGNVISTVTSNTDLVLDAQGSGSVVIDDLAIKDNTVTNTVEDGVTVFENTNNGYVKFEGTSGLVIPVGDNTNRPPIENTELGMTRFNTDDNRVEIWNGSNWISVAGSATGISRGDAEDIAFSTVIAFG